MKNIKNISNYKIGDEIYCIDIMTDTFKCCCCNNGLTKYSYTRVNYDKEIIKNIRKINGKIFYETNSVWLHEYCAKTIEEAEKLADEINQKLIEEHLNAMRLKLKQLYKSGDSYYYVSSAKKILKGE